MIWYTILFRTLDGEWCEWGHGEARGKYSSFEEAESFLRSEGWSEQRGGTLNVCKWVWIKIQTTGEWQNQPQYRIQKARVLQVAI